MDLLDTLQLHNQPERHIIYPKVPLFTANVMRGRIDKYRPHPTRFQGHLTDPKASMASTRSRSLPCSEQASISQAVGQLPRSIAGGHALGRRSPVTDSLRRADEPTAATELLTMSDNSTTADEIPCDIHSEAVTEASQSLSRPKSKTRRQFASARYQHPPKLLISSADSSRDHASNNNVCLPSVQNNHTDSGVNFHKLDVNRNLSAINQSDLPSTSLDFQPCLKNTSEAFDGNGEDDCPVSPELYNTKICSNADSQEHHLLPSVDTSVTSASHQAITSTAADMNKPEGSSCGDYEGEENKKSPASDSQTGELSNSSGSGDPGAEESVKSKSSDPSAHGAAGVIYAQLQQDEVCAVRRWAFLLKNES